MDEHTLVKKLNRRSRSALDQALSRYTSYVSAVILRTLAGRACREDVEELCADVFVALWTHADELWVDASISIRGYWNVELIAAFENTWANGVGDGWTDWVVIP